MARARTFHQFVGQITVAHGRFYVSKAGRHAATEEVDEGTFAASIASVARSHFGRGGILKRSTAARHVFLVFK